MLRARMSWNRITWAGMIVAALAAAGCRSPYRSDQGALLGGVGGAGLGAIVGHQVGHTGAGAAIGGLAGAVTGAVIGDQIDDIEARNRAEIEARIGRPVAAGAVAPEDVMEMSRAGVHEQVLVDYIRARGSARPLSTDDIIRLTQSGVSPRVINALQQPPAPRTTQVVPASSERVIVQEHYYSPGPCWGPPVFYHHHHHRRPPRPGYSVGLSLHN